MTSYKLKGVQIMHTHIRHYKIPKWTFWNEVHLVGIVDENKNKVVRGVVALSCLKSTHVHMCMGNFTR
jgi:hypothetical protein